MQELQAEYRSGKTLERRVKLILDVIIARIMFQKEWFVLQLEIHRT